MRRFTLPSLVLALGLTTIAGGQSDGLGKQLGGGKIITGATAQRLIHFTFDDGPDPETTPRLLDLLDRLHIKATFFFSASRFRGRQARNRHAADIAREALRRGHSIGSHSVDHQRMGRLSPGKLKAQLDENERLFDAVFGSRTFLFRPPFGSSNRRLDQMLHQRRYTNVMWNIGLADWVQRPPEALLRTFQKVLSRNEVRDGQRGGIVLLHDTHLWSVVAVELLVRHLEQRNCVLFAQGQPLYDIVDDLSPFYESALEGDAGVEARLAQLPDPVFAERQLALVDATRKRCESKISQLSSH